MPIEEVTESIFKLIFRGIAYFAIEILWEIVCQWIGKTTLRIITLGKYPPTDNRDYCEGCVLLLGMVIFIWICAGILYLIL